MARHSFHRIITLACIGMCLGGCTVGPDYHRPDTKMQRTWVATIAPATQSTSRPSIVTTDVPLPGQWWATLKDAELDSLVEEAAQNNLSIAAAAARVRAARAGRAGATAALFPTLRSGAEYAYERALPPLFPVDLGDYNLYGVGFDAAWEADVFGGVRRGIEEASDTLQAQIESQHDVQITVVAEICRDYIELRTAQRRIAIANDDLQIANQLLDLTQRQRAAGLSGDLDVARAKAQVTNTAAIIPPLEAQAQSSIFSLGVLLGESPDMLVAVLSPTKPIPQPPGIVPVGLPSGLLRRRPDVRRTERQLAAATAAIGVAEADLYPQFSLTGSLGVGATDTHNLFNWSSRTVSVGPSVQWLLFDAGRVLANVDARKAIREETLADYKETILGAVRDVESAIVTYDHEQDRHDLFRQTVDSDADAVRIATDQYANGVTSFIDLLDAQRSFFTAQDQLAQSDGALAIELVSLYKSLGGGWEATDQHPTTREFSKPPMPAAQIVTR